ncbi:MAG: hypothetical protein FJ299_07380 [Planctomycetes bacterium]|nr:hypothetical protein [Planctomycetota bacterium]
MSRSPLTLLVAAALFVGLSFSGACGTPRSSNGSVTGFKQAGSLGLAFRATWRDQNTGKKLELVSQTHTDAVELYSQARASADTKVQTDEAMRALQKELEARGFAKHAQSGRAPSGGAGQVLEFESPDGARHLGSRSATPEARKAYLECFLVFRDVYNYTDGLQTVENQSGGALFDDQKRKLGTQP